MIVFKTYFKILKKYKVIILVYTAILLFFTAFNGQNNTQIDSFTATKPDIAIINLDSETKETKNIYKYLEQNANIREIENDDNKIADALFYEDIHAVIYIYEGYSYDYLENKEKKLDVKYGTSSSSEYAKMLLEKYFKIADITNEQITDEDEIIRIINETLEKESQVEIKNTLNVGALEKAVRFFNFANYTILTIGIFITATIVLRFKDERIKKRNLISSKRAGSITKELYLGNVVFGLIVWIALIIFSAILIGNTMFEKNGILLIINSFVFMICGLSIGFLVGNIIKHENAVSAAVNIIGLGTSFVCGSFVPPQFLPDIVVKCSKILPSYWYVHNNEIIKTMEVIDLSTMKPILINMLIILGFSIAFIIATNFILKRVKDN